MKVKNCEFCSIQFKWKSKKGKGRKAVEQQFCSKVCYWKWHKGKNFGNSGFKKGNVPWNNGKSIQLNNALERYRENGGMPWNVGTRGKGICKPNSGSFQSGHKQTPNGTKHWNWKGGTRTLRKYIQEMDEYREWRQKVFERDGFTCVFCRVKGGRLQADHIKSFSEIISEYKIISVEVARQCKLLWNTDNGRTLCVLCHRLTPTYGGNSRNLTKFLGL